MKRLNHLVVLDICKTGPRTTSWSMDAVFLLMSLFKKDMVPDNMVQMAIMFDNFPISPEL